MRAGKHFSKSMARLLVCGLVSTATPAALWAGELTCTIVENCVVLAGCTTEDDVRHYSWNPDTKVVSLPRVEDYGTIRIDEVDGHLSIVSHFKDQVSVMATIFADGTILESTHVAWPIDHGDGLQQGTWGTSRGTCERK